MFVDLHVHWHGLGKMPAEGYGFINWAGKGVQAIAIR